MKIWKKAIIKRIFAVKTGLAFDEEENEADDSKGSNPLSSSSNPLSCFHAILRI